MISPAEESTQVVQLLDRGGNVLAGVIPDIDLDKLISDNLRDPFTLKGVLEAYIAKLNYTPLCVMLVQSEDGMWWAIEGYANPKKHTFVATMKICEFKPNRESPKRPPTAALNFVVAAAAAKGVSVWLP